MDDAYWMQAALAQAQLALGKTAPNPAVGAVVVYQDTMIAAGHTKPPGQDHAEVDVLKKGPIPAGSTLYVSLEPCCHYGRTPPCTDAILKAGISRVVVGTIDPFPLVSGQGIALLRAAGVEVVVGVLERECRKQILGFLRATLQGLPSVTLKAAITLDGRIASEAGESRWITGEAARLQGHRLRSEHDAILVGINTVLADNPLLNTRIDRGHDARPVVLDSQLKIPADAALLARNPLIFCHTDAPERSLPAEIYRVEHGYGGLELQEVLAKLAKLGYHRILAEGGGRVHRSLLASSCVEMLELFINPRILAGGPFFVSGPGFSLSEAPGFTMVASQMLGDDLHLSLEKTHNPLLES
jgi:diaminohydroxyphosphoribosylaminopyrimidine deaminase/5-amino-6-(5-phosphoribosylamino)uracil reductase